MIVKIDLSQIYDMNSKVILGNKYRRAEGNLFETGYNAVTIATGSTQSDVYQSGNIESPDYRVFNKYDGSGGIGRPDRYTNSSWGLKIFYKIIRCAINHSTSDPVMETNTSDFYVDFKVSGKTVRLTHTPSPIPSTFWDRPNAPSLNTGAASLYDNAAASLLGRAAMQVISADYYNAVVDVGVITKVEVWQNLQLSEGGPLSYYDPFDEGTLEKTHDLSGFNFSIFNNTFIADSNPFELGSAEKKYTYKYPDNWLITEKSTYVENGKSNGLINTLFQNIISNYRDGKQIVNLSVSETNYTDDTGNKLVNHIFEVGQYVKLYDATTPLIYYKLSNTCKIFEIVECEYANEQWNLVLKEVAKVESN